MSSSPSSAPSSAPRVLLVGIGGATCSGKTTLARHLAAALAPALARVGAGGGGSSSSSSSAAGSAARGGGSDAQGTAGTGASTAAGGEADTPTPTVTLVHQDDFAPPEEQLPWNDAVQARDWDAPEGAIDYARLASALRHARAHGGALPDGHASHEHLNGLDAGVDSTDGSGSEPESAADGKHSGVGGSKIHSARVRAARRKMWAARFEAALRAGRAARVGRGVSGSQANLEPVAERSAEAEPLRVVLLDGFLLYYSPLVSRELDVRLLLRARRAAISARRGARSSYATAESTGAGAENGGWTDPPGYFEHAVWPGYVRAHRRLFEGGDTEKGALVRVGEEHADSDSDAHGAPVPGLVLLDDGDLGDGREAGAGTGTAKDGDGDGLSGMERLFEGACAEVERALRAFAAGEDVRAALAKEGPA